MPKIGSTKVAIRRTTTQGIEYELQLVVSPSVVDIQKLKRNPETGRWTTRVIRMTLADWEDLLAQVRVYDRKIP